MFCCIWRMYKFVPFCRKVTVHWQNTVNIGHRRICSVISRKTVRTEKVLSFTRQNHYSGTLFCFVRYRLIFFRLVVSVSLFHRNSLRFIATINHRKSTINKPKRKYDGNILNSRNLSINSMTNIKKNNHCCHHCP